MARHQELEELTLRCPQCCQEIKPYRVFTMKLVPNWINWNRFTELSFDDLLAFILVIWNRFSLHVITQVLPVVAATVVQRLRRYGPVLGGVCSTVG